MSTPADRHRRLRAAFDEALLRDPAVRDAYLDDACAGDPELRSHVDRLLQIQAGNESFLEHPATPPTLPPADTPFSGTARFTVRRPLGVGGMGMVYEAHDGLRNEVVALKALRRTGAVDLYRLKREFRRLADVTHPNLVCLYELIVEDDRPFFTMELVDGVSFVDHVRAERGRLDLDRLVPALGQLVAGVSELHRRGTLHRDIKPSNVLVTAAGRVVLLDFGLAADTGDAHPGEAIGGTPAYMSPEEAAGATSSEASDWYSVGATLYEALTGRIPFDGTAPTVLLRKGTQDPPAPADVAADVPADLSALCMGLLQRAPDQRPTSAAIRRVLQRDTPAPAASSAGAPATTGTATPDLPFVGRLAQLQALEDARAAVERGTPRAVAVHGPSGIGKSALVRRFLAGIARRRDGLVLAGRCYENESVPYKALDGVIDDLSRHLVALPTADVVSLLPADVWALSRVFPVLLRVEVIAGAARIADPDDVDPLRVRQRAFEALGSLLRRLAARCRLAVWIDDLQWADADSAVLLDALLGTADPPAMLTLLGFRSEEIATTPFLRELLDRAGRGPWSALGLEPMPDDEAQALVRDLVPEASALSDDDRRRLTRDAGGSPFLLEQLAFHAAMPREASSPALSFAAVFEDRLGALSADARYFLTALAICGRPMAPDPVCDACEIGADRRSLVMMLRAARFIRSSGSSARVETYHDRIREVLADRLDPEGRRQIHGHLAAALIAGGSDDCEALFEHYRGAGDTDRAAAQAIAAAGRAAATLAFDRAASFYQHALDLAPASPAAPVWQEALAAALANAGRPAEAGEAYLRAALDAGHARQVELRRHAADQFLTGGHIDRGLDLIRGVLVSVGLRPSDSPRQAAVRLLWRRARLRWRGVAFTPRHAASDPEALLRIDTCWAAATGLALVDIVTASSFVAQHLLLALEAGEPGRIARGAALEWAARHAERRFRGGAAHLRALSADLAERLGTPHATAMLPLADSIVACGTGQWRRALITSERALSILRDQCVGVTWEQSIAQNMHLWALMYLGELGEVCRRVPALLADARRRGNLYLATEVCTRANFVWLIADDDPDAGEREAIAAAARWSQEGFHRQHYSALLARVQTALYRGDGGAAWRLLQEQDRALRRSLLLQVQAVRVEWRYLRGRSAIAAAASTPAARDRFLAEARACARRIAGERMPWSTPLGLLVEAGIASVEGDPRRALGTLERAVDRFDRAEMAFYGAVTRRRIGELRDDEVGREARARSAQWMAAQGAANPARLTRMLAPGFPNPS